MCDTAAYQALEFRRQLSLAAVILDSFVLAWVSYLDFDSFISAPAKQQLYALGVLKLALLHLQAPLNE